MPRSSSTEPNPFDLGVTTRAQQRKRTLSVAEEDEQEQRKRLRGSLRFQSLFFRPRRSATPQEVSRNLPVSNGCLCCRFVRRVHRRLMSLDSWRISPLPMFGLSPTCQTTTPCLSAPRCATAVAARFTHVPILFIACSSRPSDRWSSRSRYSGHPAVRYREMWVGRVSFARLLAAA